MGKPVNCIVFWGSVSLAGVFGCSEPEPTPPTPVQADGLNGPAGDSDPPLWGDADGDGDAPDNGDSDDNGDGDGDPTVDAPPSDEDFVATIESCYPNLVASDGVAPDYTPLAPVVGSHCMGTNHQDITGVERVVFVGDSVTVGSPPTLPHDFYRSRLAPRLAQRFSILPPEPLWSNVDLIGGVPLMETSRDFSVCAKYGARTDDLMRDRDLLERCLPPEERHKTTLVIMTMGGNDLFSLAKDGGELTLEENRAQVEEFVQLLRDAVLWLKEPGRFPNGVYLIFSNMHEYTDGTGDVSACSAAALAGLTGDWGQSTEFQELVVWAMEQYLSIAVETQTDMVFMLEHFCGHGWKHDDPSARCYLGPDAERWVDLTCIHPNPTGHGILADMIEAVVAE